MYSVRSTCVEIKASGDRDLERHSSRKKRNLKSNISPVTSLENFTAASEFIKTKSQNKTNLSDKEESKNIFSYSHGPCLQEDNL